MAEEFAIAIREKLEKRKRAGPEGLARLAVFRHDDCDAICREGRGGVVDHAAKPPPDAHRYDDSEGEEEDILNRRETATAKALPHLFHLLFPSP